MRGYTVLVRVDPDDAEARLHVPLVPKLDALVRARAAYSVTRWFADCQAYHDFTPISLRCHILDSQRDLGELPAVLPFHLALVSEPEAWAQIVRVVDYGDPVATVDVGGREVTVYVLDLMKRSLTAWCQGAIRRMLRTLETGETLTFDLGARPR
jgi:hypothetical protein